MSGRAPERRRIALRSALLQAVWNYETLQGVGFGWALLPALSRLYADPAARARRLQAHLDVFNSNPYLATMGLGVAVRMEEVIARRGEKASAASAVRVGRLLRALHGTLGAVGDAFFWAGWRPAMGLAAAVAALVLPGPWPALAFLLAWNGLAQTIRWRGVGAGFASGAGIARVLHDAFWRRGAAAAGVVGAAAAAAAAGAGLSTAFRSDGGLTGVGIFSLSVVLLWLGPRAGSRRPLVSPATAFLALVILLSALFHLSPGAMPW